MLGRIITALAGQAVAKRIGGASAGPLGVVAGLVLPVVARRLGPLGMVGVAAGSWVMSRAVAKMPPPKVLPPPR